MQDIVLWTILTIFCYFYDLWKIQGEQNFDINILLSKLLCKVNNCSIFLSLTCKFSSPCIFKTKSFFVNHQMTKYSYNSPRTIFVAFLSNTVCNNYKYLQLNLLIYLRNIILSFFIINNLVLNVIGVIFFLLPYYT